MLHYIYLSYLLPSPKLYILCIIMPLVTLQRMRMTVNVKVKSRQLQAAQKVCCLCLKVDSVTTIHLKMSNLNTSGPKCIILTVGVFLLIVLYSMFTLMVECCMQEYMNCDVLGYSRVW